MSSGGRVYRPRVRRGVDPTHEHFSSCGPKGCYFETSIWWLKYYVRGQVHYESSETDSKRDAQRLLRERLSARESGKLIGRPDRVVLAAYRGDKLVGGLRAELERHYRSENNRSLTRVQQAFAHLEAFFTPETLALDITRSWVAEYIEHRFDAEAGRGTVRYEVAMLNAAFSVAVESGLLALRPEFKLPAAADPREGFFAQGDIAALLLELPAYLRPVVRFAALVGWRKEVVVGLQWADVDWEGAVITVPGSRMKGKKPVLFPFKYAPELREILEDQRTAQDGPFVFHEHGRRIKTFFEAWNSACERAGLTGRLFHDLRRTAARDLRRAGVDTKVIMKLCGWETDSMFRRYNIVDEIDLAESVAKRFPQPTGKQ